MLPADTFRSPGFYLRFPSMRQAGRAYAFPCDRQGTVCLDELSDRARTNFFRACDAVGQDLLQPRVVPADR